MCHGSSLRLLLHDPRLYPWLSELDREMAQEARSGGCVFCGGRLDSADYPRKPRGGPPDLSEEYQRRLSFCCAEDGCRRRLTPPSVRFLGRRVYLGAVVVLISAMLQGASPPRSAQLYKLFGVSARTLSRWLRWWRTTFVESAFWKVTRGLLKTPPEPALLPLSLLACLEASHDQERLVVMLKLLSPITTGSARSSVAC